MESEGNSEVERVKQGRSNLLQNLALQDPSKLGMVRDGLLIHGSLFKFPSVQEGKSCYFH